MQVAELQRQNRVVPEQRRSQPSPEAEKKHSSAAITSERLHGRVVHDPDWLAERFPKIKTRPAFPEIFRFDGDLSIFHRCRKTEGHGIEFPVFQSLLCFGDKLARRQAGTGGK